ncbi:SMB-1 family subclass B3 metallo-beta-lactamase [Pseudoduganella sp. DS3]|uniref:SMB-1 family subclass B3 metallo-beta-lactamase n=1 Tax=Pseudoduganella guangdongensis TaxID=2692179 RepID=A0A6N9HNR1_9BURK|nr:SMB-1 family subclass B3 metallo-beta-lactamase [Pseudoduganella guangdongensis]MYN05124.1 SMB-1 family subclass B3 metallo-beta-lactamase [Pseudoduganella guangdongensis]
MKLIASLILAAFASVASVAHAQDRDWSSPQQPFTIYGNTHYVGTGGISAVLVTSPKGHILVDGTTSKGAEVVAANIRSMGFKLKDVKYILSTHSHEDHAGGISALQKLTGATVLGGAANVETLRSGVSPKSDPQFGSLSNFPGAAKVRAVADGEVVKLGPLAVKAHSTPGHTEGGVTWSWQSCEAGKCRDVVFVDSLTAVSADSYRFSEHPEVVASLQSSFEAVEKLTCDIAIAAHPEVNDMWGRQQRAAKEGNAAYVDNGACRAIAAAGRKRLETRLASEKR